MLLRMNKGLLTLATLAAVSLLGTARSARADLQIALQEDSGVIKLVAVGADFTSASTTITYGDFTVKVFGGSSDNDATLSDLLGSTTSVKNNSSSQHTLHLWVSQDNYNKPTGTPMLIESGLGGSQTTAGNVTLTNIFQAYADASNTGLFADGTAVNSTIASAPSFSFTNNAQTALATGTTFDTGSKIGSFPRTNSTSKYSLVSVTNFQLKGGATANFSNHINATATPEPATLVSAVVGLGLLGGVRWARRRRTA